MEVDGLLFRGLLFRLLQSPRQMEAGCAITIGRVRSWMECRGRFSTLMRPAECQAANLG